jgi:LCP family protein required for cell wall assembly
VSRRLRWAAALLAVVQVVVLGTATATAARRWLAAPLDGDDPYVLLVLGSDEGPPRAGRARTGRADGFHLVVVDAGRTRVSILSLPRDSLVDVPGVGRTRINTSLTRGPETAVATAERLTGLEVDDWILTGFHGFIAAVDALGGLQIDVEQRLYDPGGASTDLQPGPQRLSGWQALAYTRDRMSRPGGDRARAESHARALQALHAQVRAEAPDAARLAELVGILRRHTETSIPPHRLFRLAGLALTIDPADVTRARVPGTDGRSSGGAAILRLTPEAEQLFADLRDDGVLDAVPVP